MGRKILILALFGAGALLAGCSTSQIARPNRPSRPLRPLSANRLRTNVPARSQVRRLYRPKPGLSPW